MEQSPQGPSLRDQKDIHKINNQYPHVEVQRSFKAPLELVWRAWSDVRMIKQWWGPAGFTCPSAQIEFREGGRYHLAMKSPLGEVTWSLGIYEQIIPFQTIVCTDQFADEDGNPINANQAGLPGSWPDTLFLTIDFERIKDRDSKIRIVHEGIPASMQEDCVNGWSSSLDKLQSLVEWS